MASVMNKYFHKGLVTKEQDLYEDLIIEAMRIHGDEFFYIPRTLISKDDILGEDRLSEFNHAYPIEMYFDNIESFDGGAFAQRWGVSMESGATLTVARKRWNELVGANNTTIVPDRPNEGDLLYWPRTKTYFQINYVEHRNPFYQVGRLYVYKLSVQLFQYSSEKINTGVEEIDALGFKSTDLDFFEGIGATPEEMEQVGELDYGQNKNFKEQSVDVIFDERNPFGEL